MKEEDELALRVTKEIVIKFIEMGRLSINSFDEAFSQIHATVRNALVEAYPAGKGPADHVQ